MIMKTKMLLLAALISAATVSAHAGVCFGFSFGVPVAVAPAPVVVAAPVAPVVVASPYAAPGYLWYPGYWSVGVGGRVWVPGGWRHGYGHGGYGYGWGHGGGHGGWRR